MLHFYKTKSDTSEHIPLLLDLIGLEYEQEPANRPNGTDGFECILSIKGYGEVKINGENEIVKTGECVMLHPGNSCSYHALDEKWIVAIVGFSGRLCETLLESLGLSESGVYSLKDPNRFVRDLRKLYHLTQVSDDQAGWSPACYQFLLELSQEAGRIHLVQDLKDSSEDSYSYRIISYMEDHIADPIYLPELADLLGLNPQYLCAVFHFQHMQASLCIYSRLSVLLQC